MIDRVLKSAIRNDALTVYSTTITTNASEFGTLRVIEPGRIHELRLDAFWYRSVRLQYSFSRRHYIAQNWTLPDNKYNHYLVNDRRMAREG